MAQSGSSSCTALGSVRDFLVSPSLHDAGRHPVQDTGTPGRQNPQKTPLWFSWQVPGKSSCPLKMLPGLRTQKEKGKDEACWRWCYLGVQRVRILPQVCYANLGCAPSPHFSGPPPDFCLIYCKGDISGSQADSCCVCATRQRGSMCNFADIQALQRDDDKTATVFPKYLFCLCS